MKASDGTIVNYRNGPLGASASASASVSANTSCSLSTTKQKTNVPFWFRRPHGGGKVIGKGGKVREAHKLNQSRR